MPYTNQGTGYQRRDTSAAAAVAIEPKAGTIQAKALALFRNSKTRSLTADEVADKLGLPFISVRPRITELAAKGRIVDSGTRREGSFGRDQIAWKFVY